VDVGSGQKVVALPWPLFFLLFIEYVPVIINVSTSNLRFEGHLAVRAGTTIRDSDKREVKGGMGSRVCQV
jgi:hypothetical protein